MNDSLLGPSSRTCSPASTPTPRATATLSCSATGAQPPNTEPVALKPNTLFIRANSLQASKKSLFGKLGNSVVRCWPRYRNLSALPSDQGQNTGNSLIFRPYQGIRAIETGLHVTASTTRQSPTIRVPRADRNSRATSVA